jgi:hypothetical protein
MSSWSKEALKLGAIQLELEAIEGLDTKALTSELLRMCARDGISFKSYCYLERVLITNKGEQSS